MRRFNSEKSGYGGEAMTEDPEGDYVLYSDHLDIIKEKDRAMNAFYRSLQSSNHEIKRLQGELATTLAYLDELKERQP